jgi:nickel-dependent lactate racemase
MNKTYKFKYGKACFNVALPGKAAILTIKEPEFCLTREQFTKDFSLCMPETLSNCHAASFAVSIVVADKTRLCEYKNYLPWVVEILQKKNIQKHQIRFFIAYGTHAAQSDSECLSAYGDIYTNYEFIHHDSSDKNLFIYLGRTERGTKIHVRKDIIESDLIITFGALSHHYFAGYGGGRKLLFPGLGYKPDIYRNHELFLDKKLKKLSIGCRPGNFENNPIAHDLKQIDDAVNIPRISIHGILDSKARVCQLVVGKSYNDFLNACNTLDSYYKVRDKDQYNLVIASCGGFPKDINFIQAHKAINNAAMFVKNKGSLIMTAQCPDGIGSDTFLEYFEFQNFEQAFSVLEDNYRGNGGTALSMMTKTGRINIFIKTNLDDKVCKKIGMRKIETTMIQTMLNEFKGDIACVDNASLLVV